VVEDCSAMMTRPKLTPRQRQEVLRRLKRGPVLTREELARWAVAVRDEVVARDGERQSAEK